MYNFGGTTRRNAIKQDARGACAVTGILCATA
jgi:hypothetical protein